MIRVAAAVATAGATEAIAATIGDVAISESANEFAKATDNFWKKEQTRKTAMDEFRANLIALTPKIGAAGKDEESKQQHRKLIIVVDELDRCRPDYSLSLLEIMKHFFDVPNVHFVLGVKLSALENSVRARYGSGMEATLYLEKLINLTTHLPNKTDMKVDVNSKYFDNFRNKDPHLAHVNQYTKIYIQLLKKCSLRDVQKIISLADLLPSKIQNEYDLVIVAVGMLVSKVCEPNLYNQIINAKTATERADVLDKVSELYQLHSGELKSLRDSQIKIQNSWQKAINNAEHHDDFSHIRDEYLEAFEPYKSK